MNQSQFRSPDSLRRSLLDQILGCNLPKSSPIMGLAGELSGDFTESSQSPSFFSQRLPQPVSRDILKLVSTIRGDSGAQRTE
jgi:hypothetical protein